MDSLVFDTSALLNFGHRGELTALLKRLSGEYKILTTPGARNELTDPKRHDYYTEFLREHFTVQSATTTPFDLAILVRLLRTIDPGELSVLTLTAELKGIAVLDDKAARREAQNLGLQLTGTLGLLQRAAERKWMTQADCLARVIQLRAAGFNIPRPAPHHTFTEYLRTLE